MKKLLLLTLCPFYFLAQFTDDFQSLENWIADTAHFEIDSFNQLHLLAPAISDKATICHTSSALINGYWQIDIAMDFNPSSSNYTQIHLSLDSLGNGYFVKLGGTTDEVSLFKTQNETTTKLIDGADDFLDLDSVALRLLVKRDSIGN